MPEPNAAQATGRKFRLLELLKSGMIQFLL